MGPPANLERDLTHDIQAAAASTADIHPEVPSHTFVARFAGISKVLCSLEDNPSLAVDAGIGITVHDHGLSAIDLVTGWIEPGFDTERESVRRVQCRIPGDDGPRG